MKKETYNYYFYNEDSSSDDNTDDEAYTADSSEEYDDNKHDTDSKVTNINEKDTIILLQLIYVINLTSFLKSKFLNNKT